MLTLLEATAPTGKPVPSAVRPHMNPLTHALLGWTLAQVVPLTRRDRALVTLAGVVPDIAGLGVVAELLTRDRAHPLLWWSEYHHVLAHNVGGAPVVTIAVICLAHRRWVGAALACFFAWQRGYAPLEFVSTRADQHFVQALRVRFGAAHLPLRKP
jgi:hypothetical protein